MSYCYFLKYEGVFPPFLQSMRQTWNLTQALTILCAGQQSSPYYSQNKVKGNQESFSDIMCTSGAVYVTKKI